MQQGYTFEKRVGPESRRLEAVVKTLATIGGPGESIAAVAHDARNMVTALGLYCDLLEEPGVLAGEFSHYGSELRLIAEASRSLVEKLVELDADGGPGTRLAGSARVARRGAGLFAGHEIAGKKQAVSLPCWEPTGGALMSNLAAELLANHNLLAALAGPGIPVTVDVEGGAKPVRMTGEDLTRVLVNLVKNAAESMGASGRVQIGLRALPGTPGESDVLVLTLEDNGPGIPDGHLDTIFTAGYTTHLAGENGNGNWGASHRGQGLAIVRSIVNAAGGCVFAANRIHGGARFEIRLPVREA